MNKEEVIDLIQDAGFGCLATSENGQPRVRPMMPYLNDDGNLLLALLSHSRTIPQIKQNPKVEFCFLDRKMCFCRVTGKAKVLDDLEKKTTVWENVPMLRQYFSSASDPNYVLVEIDSESVEAMTPQQKVPDILSLK